MKQTVKYFTNTKGTKTRTVEFDDEAPCQCCGEPVIAASMGGTSLCPSCDMGKCRYCGMPIMVLRKEIDGDQSKRDLLEHMKMHRKAEPDFNKKSLEAYREFRIKFRKRNTG